MLLKERKRQTDDGQLRMKFTQTSLFHEPASKDNEMDYFMKIFHQHYSKPIPVAQRHNLMKTLVSNFIDLNRSQQSYSAVHAVGLLAQFRAIMKDYSRISEVINIKLC